MKKALYASTALAAAGLLSLASSDAFAQAAAPAAAQKLQIAVGGYMIQTVGYSDQSIQASNSLSFANTVTPGAQGRKHFDQHSDSEIYFKGSVNLDNGLTVSLVMELEADIDAGQVTSSNTQSQGTNMDETYMTIGSADVGTLYLGATNAASFYLGVAAPWSGLNFFDGTLGQWILSPSTANAAPSSAPISRAPSAGSTTYNGSFDYNRVEYVSPSFWGVRVGGGYAPSTTQSQVQPAVNETDHTNAAVQWAPTFIDGVKPRLYGGWWRTNGSTSTTTDSWSTGADVAIGDFILGAGGLTTRHRYNGFTTTAGQPDGYAWNVGIKYAPGPFSVALTYAHASAEDTDAIARNDTHDRIALGADYILGPGVTLVGDLQGQTYKDENSIANGTTGSGQGNHGWAIITGIKLDF